MIAPRFVRRCALAACLVALLLIALPVFGMDKVRSLTYANSAVSEFGVTGAGVVTAILDRGIDWKNADFRNDDGSTRIAYIFDLSDDSGAHAAGNTYGMGTIYTRQQIDAALQSSTELATRDAVGHGTTTAGILAGNGRNLESRKYRGIAPESTIIAIKIAGGAPAHDDQAQEPHFFDPARIPVAIDFARDKAEQYAALAGQRLGDVKQIAEAGVGGPVPIGKRMMAMSDAAGAPPVDGGEGSVDAVLTVSWALEPLA